jgi:hypothetical protein
MAADAGVAAAAAPLLGFFAFIPTAAANVNTNTNTNVAFAQTNSEPKQTTTEEE